MINEFNQILATLKKDVNHKTELLQSKSKFNSHSQGKVNNVIGRIANLEEAAKDITLNYNGNQNMLLNFKKRANDIGNEIDELNC